MLLRRSRAERISPPSIFLSVKFDDCGCSSSRACSSMAALIFLTSASSSILFSSSSVSAIAASLFAVASDLSSIVSAFTSGSVTFMLSSVKAV